MPEERTDEQRLLQAPLELQLGGQVVQVRPLVMRRSSIWRRELLALIEAQLGPWVAGQLQAQDIARVVLLEVPDALLALVARYLELAEAPVSREWLEDHATDAEVYNALRQLVEVAFPFGILGGDLGRLVAGLPRTP